MAHQALAAVLLIVLPALCAAAAPAPDGAEPSGAKNMSEAALVSILERAATVSGFLIPHSPGAPVAANTTDTIRMLAHTGARYAGRSVFVWGGEAAIPKMLPHVKATAAAAHAAVPNLVLEGGVFEIVTVQRSAHLGFSTRDGNLVCRNSGLTHGLTHPCRCVPAEGRRGVADHPSLRV
jgi:hypothetical protein